MLLNKNIDHLLKRLSALVAGSTSLLVLSLVYESCSLMIYLDQTCLSNMLARIVPLQKKNNTGDSTAFQEENTFLHFALVI